VSEFTDKILAIRKQTRDIRRIYENTGTIEPKDLDFLIDKTIRHTIISDLAERDWIALKALQLTSQIEIEELKRQLKEALGN
jgi:hypothetical protein